MENEKFKLLQKLSAPHYEYHQTIKQLITLYSRDENTPLFNSVKATCLILLLTLSGNYKKCASRRLSYKSLFKNNNEYTNLFKISKLLRHEPYCNISNCLNFFFGSNSMEVNQIVQAFNIYYQREQAEYISKFYSKISLGTLKKLTGKKLY